MISRPTRSLTVAEYPLQILETDGQNGTGTGMVTACLNPASLQEAFLNQSLNHASTTFVGSAQAIKRSFCGGQAG